MRDGGGMAICKLAAVEWFASELDINVLSHSFEYSIVRFVQVINIIMRVESCVPQVLVSLKTYESMHKLSSTMYWPAPHL